MELLHLLAKHFSGATSCCSANAICVNLIIHCVFFFFNSLQEGMFHHGLLQRMLRRPATNGRGRKDPNVDQATPWS